MEKFLKPYEGTEPYIFVSYSRRDSDKVFEILDRLRGKGLNFWYNTEINQNDERQELLIKHINNCKCALAFHSTNSKDSAQCKDEIFFIRKKCDNENFISIYLEDVTLSIGVQMSIHQCPRINLYDYTDFDKEKFYSQLLNKINSSSASGGINLAVPGLSGVAVGVIAAAVVGKNVAGDVAGVAVSGLSNIFGSFKSFFSRKKESYIPHFNKTPQKPLTAYEGKEPYAFISYSHKDSDRVFEILRKLQAAGLKF